MPRPFLCKVDPFCVAKREILHDARKGGFTRLDDEVYMVCHETKTMDTAAELFYYVLQQEIETAAVELVDKNRLSGIAAKNDMVDSAGIMYAGFTCHEKTI